MGHTMGSATEAAAVALQNWQQRAKMNKCNFVNVNKTVHTRMSIIQMEPNIINVGMKMNLNRY